MHKLCIHDTWYRDKNGFHIETINKNNIEYLYIVSSVIGQKCILEKLSAFSSDLYYMTIKAIESHVVILWHDCLDHSGWTIICRNVENSHGHPLKILKIHTR